MARRLAEPRPGPVRIIANRRLNKGLLDANAPGRVPPQRTSRRYPRPVRVEVVDDELYRLLDPAGAPDSGSPRTGRP